MIPCVEAHFQELSPIRHSKGTCVFVGEKKNGVYKLLAIQIEETNKSEKFQINHITFWGNFEIF